MKTQINENQLRRIIREELLSEGLFGWLRNLLKTSDVDIDRGRYNRGLTLQTSLAEKNLPTSCTILWKLSSKEYHREYQFETLGTLIRNVMMEVERTIQYSLSKSSGPDRVLVDIVPQILDLKFDRTNVKVDASIISNIEDSLRDSLMQKIRNRFTKEKISDMKGSTRRSKYSHYFDDELTSRDAKSQRSFKDVDDQNSKLDQDIASKGLGFRIPIFGKDTVAAYLTAVSRLGMPENNATFLTVSRAMSKIKSSLRKQNRDDDEDVSPAALYGDYQLVNALRNAGVKGKKRRSHYEY